MEADTAIGTVYLWHLLAGATGAAGNQLMYWRNRAKRPSQSLNRRMIPISFAYIVVGAAIGFFVGLSTGPNLNLILLSLGAGAAWPDTLRMLEASRQVALLVQKKLQDQELVPTDGAGGGRGA